MNYIIIFLLFFLAIIIILGVFIFFQFSDRIEEFTGINSLPSELAGRLSYLDFERRKENRIFQMYHYNIETSDAKRVFVVLTNNDDIVYDGNKKLDYPLYSYQNKKVLQVCLPEDEDKRNFRVITEGPDKPKAYVGTLNQENDN